MADKYIDHVVNHKDNLKCEIHNGEELQFFCISCGVAVCRDCLVLQHPKSDHKITQLIIHDAGVTRPDSLEQERTKMDDGIMERAEKQADVLPCPKHSGEKQHFFCVTCGVMVCRECLVLEHQISRHEVKDLKDFTVTQKAKMRTKMGRVEQAKTTLEDDAKKLDDMEKKLEAAREQAEKDVKERIQVAVLEVEAKGKEAVAAIEATYKQRMETVKEKQYKTKDIVAQLSNIHTMIQNVVDLKSDHIYMKEHLSLAAETKKISTIYRQHQMPSHDLASLQFKPGSGQVNSAWFGKVVTDSGRKCKLTLIREFGAFLQAQGIAVSQTGKAVAIVDSKAKEVIVYYNADGQYKQKFRLGSVASSSDAEITNPLDVAATSEGKFLIAHGGRVIKAFLSCGRYEKKLTSVGNRIAVTPDGHLVIGSNEPAITVRQPDGKLIRTHHVDCEAIAGIASNGKQIAFTTGKKGNTVHVIDFVTGQTIWKADMQIPYGICYEPNSQSLLVARGLTDKVGDFVLDQYCSTTGSKIGNLVSNLFNPFSMTVTDDNKLYVADMKSVKVYTVAL